MEVRGGELVIRFRPSAEVRAPLTSSAGPAKFGFLQEVGEAWHPTWERGINGYRLFGLSVPVTAEPWPRG